VFAITLCTFFKETLYRFAGKWNPFPLTNQNLNKWIKRSCFRSSHAFYICDLSPKEQSFKNVQRFAAALAWKNLYVLSQITKVWQHFRDLKAKPSKGF